MPSFAFGEKGGEETLHLGLGMAAKPKTLESAVLRKRAVGVDQLLLLQSTRIQAFGFGDLGFRVSGGVGGFS